MLYIIRLLIRDHVVEKSLEELDWNPWIITEWVDKNGKLFGDSKCPLLLWNWNNNGYLTVCQKRISGAQAMKSIVLESDYRSSHPGVWLACYDLGFFRYWAKAGMMPFWGQSWTFFPLSEQQWTFQSTKTLFAIQKSIM